MKILVPIVVIAIGLAVATLAIAITTLVKVNKGFDQTQDSDTTTAMSSTMTTTTITTATTTISQPSPNDTLATYVSITNMMNYLNELQSIATATGGTRAINTAGFNQTLDYIVETLSTNTDYNVTTTFFPVRQISLTGNPIFISSINDTVRNHTYSSNPSASEFYYVQFSTAADFPDFVELTVIPNLGCTDDDWLAASPSPSDRVALVERGNCTFVEKVTLASAYNVTALLIYNDGTAPDRIPPIFINVGPSNTLPILFLSYTLGQQLADAAQDPTANVSVIISIPIDDSTIPVGNICADTPTGDPTQTIVIGSHSDGVPAGPGINDNGSGSVANLELALALARLFQTSTYATYKYRVRFCWWGAEEVGLLGADYHVRQAKNSTIVGERLSDYLINLNYDMLGSPNFMLGIYDGRTANIDTPVQALEGSRKITSLFIDWFDQQNLPWNYTDFSGRSDYGPFLAAGVVAGGLFSGADDIKSQAERDYYDAKLGLGMGGIAGAIHDPCYHQACDSIQNINIFAYEKLTQAAAYVLEYLARQNDLKTWLYPNGTAIRADNQEQQREYDSINEYFRLPYL